MQLNSVFSRIYFSNHFFKELSDVASSVFPKAQVCSALTVAAYVAMGASRGWKGGFIYPYFYGILLIKFSLF